MQRQTALKVLNNNSRNAIGVAICIISAGLGVLALRRGWVPDKVAGCVAFAWLSCGLGLAGRLNYRRLSMPVGAIYRETKDGKLPQEPPLVRAMIVGGNMLFVASIVLLVMRLRS